MEFATTSSLKKQVIDHEVIFKFHRTKIDIIDVLLHTYCNGEKTFEVILLTRTNTLTMVLLLDCEDNQQSLQLWGEIVCDGGANWSIETKLTKYS